MRLRRAAIAAAVPALTLAGCGAPADTGADFPSETIEIIIGFDAGGSTDVNTRALAAAAEGTCGTNIIISNQPGGSGAIALQSVANSEPNGYTLGTTPTELSALDHLGLSELTHEDFAAVIRFVVDPHGFFVRPDSPYKSIDDVVAAARGGERIEIATSGPASPYAFTFQDLARKTGVAGQLVNVPYSGDAAAIPAGLSGEVDVLATNASGVIGQVQSGQLVPLALAAEERIDAMANVPTFQELGIDVTGGSIYGLAAPAETPQERLDVLSDCFAAAFESPEFQQFLEQQGRNPAYLDAASFDAYLAEEYQRYGELVGSLNLSGQ